MPYTFIIFLILSINRCHKYISSFLKNFDAAAERVKTLQQRPTDMELLELYGYFKQASFGDNTTSTVKCSNLFLLHIFMQIMKKKIFFKIASIEKPGMLDLKGKAKWNSWNDRKGLTTDEAKEKYISFVDGLMTKYSN